MTSLIDRIKDTLQGSSHNKSHDESSHAHGHDRQVPPARPKADHERPEGAEHGKKGHKHC